jgi:hypothetical protein
MMRRNIWNRWSVAVHRFCNIYDQQEQLLNKPKTTAKTLTVGLSCLVLPVL